MCIIACKLVHLLQTFPESSECIRYAAILPFLSTPAHPYLELASVVIVCGSLSALLQRDEGETSEISRAGRQEDHCKGGESMHLLRGDTEL